VILDVSQAENPQFVGQTQIFPDVVYRVAVVGHYVYAAVGYQLYVIDVADPTNPVNCTASPSYGVGELAASGGQLYALVGGPAVGVFDLSDPTAPVLVGTCPVSYWAAALAVEGDYAYYITLFRLEIVDVSDPAAPFMVSSTPRESPYRVAAQNGYVYLGTEWYEGDCYLRVIDAANPYLPVEVGRCVVPGLLEAVTVYGASAYVTTDLSSTQAGLYVIDVSDPGAPAVVGFSLLDTLSPSDVMAADDFAYVVDMDRGLRTFDVHTPTAPQQVGGYTVAGGGYAVTVAGGCAYFDGRRGGLNIIDITDPAEPVRTAFRPEGGFVRVVGNIGYSASGYGGLEIFDLSDPTNPVLLGVFDDMQYVGDVAVAGSYAYLADWTGVIVVDVSDPSAPVQVGMCSDMGIASGIDVSANYAYVVGHHYVDGALWVVDVSDPAAPTVVANCPALMPERVQVVGPYAYVMTYSEGFDVIDVSDPLSPHTIGQVVGAGGEDLHVVGDFAYLATQTRLRVYDVLDRSAPALVADVNWTPGRPYGVAVRDGYAYVADGQGGLTVLSLHISGDLNCDGLIDFGDINTFVLALCSPAEYAAIYPDCHGINADINRDGLVDLGDINPFVALLTGR
jgi:hypothetical protein